MRIGILGPLEVVRNGRAVDVGGARLRALLILLALDADRVVSADRLIAGLWEDDPPAGAPNALQSLVSRLRAAVGRDLVESRSTGYRLAVPPSAVDAYDFEDRLAVARGQADPAERAASLRAALRLWRGPALADVGLRPFAEGPVARLEELRRTALEERAEADLALGRYGELIPELEALAAADPLREPLRGQLMRALYGAGRQADALAVYEDTKRALGEALGVDPSAELENVYLSVLRRDPALAAVPVPEARVERPRGNLRAQLTSFIGREEDLKRVCKLLGEARLVTLIGPGGAGKTRLSVESGAELLDRSPDGVWLIELAPIVDPAEVPHAVLSVLGLRETAMSAPRRRTPVEVADPLDRLVAALADKRLLLLLDNCEHLIDAAARLADRLLAGCPGVRVLATSREPLGITGETLWPVEPLALPPDDTEPDTAMTYPAIRLLSDRAGAVRPGFTVSEANVAHIVRICRALDGMPLAIELAAARLRAMTPQQVASRLDDRFRLLTAGSRTALPRHQTLRAVVGWSWELLDEAEQVLWRRLAIFSGGATVDSAEAVCAGGPLAAADVLDALTALVEKSLLIVTDEGAAPRYRMLETIRAYGLERLDQVGEQAAVRCAHATYFVELAETAEPLLRSREQVVWMPRLTAEHDNMYAALRWTISAGEPAMAVRFCAALGWYWWLRGHRAEGIDVAAEVLAMPGLPAGQITAIACTVTAVTSFGSSRDLEVIKSWLRRAREIIGGLSPDEPLHPILRMLSPMLELSSVMLDERSMVLIAGLFDDPDRWVRSFAHFLYAEISVNRGLLDGIEEHYGLALDGFRALGERWGMSFVLTSLADFASWDGRHRDAVVLYQDALTMLAELGSGDDTPSHVHFRIAGQLWHLGEFARAREVLGNALRLAERSGSIDAMAAAHFQFGEFARQSGDYDEAAVRLARASELARGITGSPQFRAMVLACQGHLAVARGDLEAASTLHRDALREAAGSMDLPIMANSLLGFAELALLADNPERAAELLGMARGLRGLTDLSNHDEIRLTRATRAALPTPTYNHHHTKGRSQDVETILATFNMTLPPPTTI